MSRFALAAASLALAACQSAPPRDPAAAAATAAAATACRERVDQVHAQRNRVELSMRDQRDTPFSSSYLSGITSRGLGAQFSRGEMFDDCVNAAGGGARGGAGRAGTGGGVTGGGGPTEGHGPGATGSAMSPIAR